MKILLLWLAMGLFTLSHAATNLVANGDFETNVLTPWTGTSATVTTVGANHLASIATIAGKIEQSFATTAGTTYYVGADMAPDIASLSAGTVTVQADGGGAVLGSRSKTGVLLPGTGIGRTGFVFTATTAMTKIIFTVTSPLVGVGTPGMTVDDVVVYELKPGTLAGRYSGTLTTTSAITTPGAASTKVVTRLAGRVTSDGVIVLVSGALTQGVVFSDGTIEIPALGVRTTATVKRGRITFTVPAAFPLSGLALTGADASNTTAGTLGGTSTTTYVITRVGK